MNRAQLLSRVAVAVLALTPHSSSWAEKAHTAKLAQKSEAKTEAKKPGRAPSQQASEPVLFTRDGVIEFVAKDGCSRASVRVDEHRLREKGNPKGPDLFAYCNDQCGMRGCTYYVFLAHPFRYKQYAMAGVVDGLIQPLESFTRGYRDLSMTRQMDSEDPVSRTWRFNGHEYE